MTGRCARDLPRARCSRASVMHARPFCSEMDGPRARSCRQITDIYDVRL